MSGSGSISAAELFLLLVAASTIVAILTRRNPILPYSVGLVVLGLAVSALNLPVQLTIGPELLLTVLLPGLVFEAAYRTDLRNLWQSSGAVAFLAVPGVLITAAVVGLVVDAVTGIGFVLAFLVGTMLAATDPAAVIAVVSHLRAPPRLITLIEAESLFNDGTGIVLFALALTAVGAEVHPAGVVLNLITTVVISSGIGALLGFLASRGVIWVEDHLVEVTISLLAAYGSYRSPCASLSRV